jgi:5-methylcytosine-specific restriction endonuclease McrA
MQKKRRYLQIKKRIEKRKYREEAQRVARKLKKTCQCGQTKNLTIHHKDLNIKNNLIENLEILCIECHKKQHETTN